MSNEVATISNSRLAALAGQAKDAAAKERPSVSKVSLKSGMVSVGGSPCKDNKLEGIILVATYRNTFYKGRYDPNNISNPNCFAFSEVDDDLAPHINVSTPVSPTCDACPNAEWGSDPGGGRGKACKQTRRLVLMPATVLDAASPVDAIKTAELAILDVPVTSVKNYSQYVNVLAASIGLPMWACVTEMWTQPDAKTQFKLNFKGIKAVPSDDILDALEVRKNEALRIGLLGYDTSNDEEEEALPAASAKPATKKKF
jgi:hypothetical protein